MMKKTKKEPKSIDSRKDAKLLREVEQNYPEWLVSQVSNLRIRDEGKELPEDDVSAAVDVYGSNISLVNTTLALLRPSPLRPFKPQITNQKKRSKLIGLLHKAVVKGAFDDGSLLPGMPDENGQMSFVEVD